MKNEFKNEKKISIFFNQDFNHLDLFCPFGIENSQEIFKKFFFLKTDKFSPCRSHVTMMMVFISPFDCVINILMMINGIVITIVNYFRFSIVAYLWWIFCVFPENVESISHCDASLSTCEFWFNSFLLMKISCFSYGFYYLDPWIT